MNRAIRVVGFLLTAAIAGGQLPGQSQPGAEGAEADPIERIVTSMREAEGRLKSLRLELATEGAFPGGVSFSTAGTLHVLRGEQRRVRTSVRFRYADGLESRTESVRTAAGIKIYSEDPAFGAVFVRVPPVIVRDLEWAGTVLDRSDLPGMHDPRAEAPLGSAMLDDLRLHFELQPRTDTRRGDDPGTWLAGPRKPGLGDVDPELPLADRVELFVRDRDRALLEIVHHQGDKVLQRIVVHKLEVDVEIASATFEVDGNDQPLREVDQHLPLWTQIENAIRRAEAKLLPADLAPDQEPPPASLRPSRRKQ